MNDDTKRSWWKRIVRIYHVLLFAYHHYDELCEILGYNVLQSRAQLTPSDVSDPERYEPNGMILTLILALLTGMTIIAMCLGCNVPARAQEPTARTETPIVSVFGERFPEIMPGQILVQRHLYTAAIDPDAKQPVWVAYTVQRSSWDTSNVLSRNFTTPRNLQPYCLEQSDYANSGYELGHLYGLQFVAAEAHAAEVNQLCVIAAQRPELNKGPWLAAENRIKAASESQPVQVLAGLMWHIPMPPLANADEPHNVASHCWLIFSPGPDGVEEAYKIPQAVERSADLNQFAIDPQQLRDEISTLWTRSI